MSHGIYNRVYIISIIRLYIRLVSGMEKCTLCLYLLEIQALGSVHYVCIGRGYMNGEVYTIFIFVGNIGIGKCALFFNICWEYRNRKVYFIVIFDANN